MIPSADFPDFFDGMVTQPLDPQLDVLDDFDWNEERDAVPAPWVEAAPPNQERAIAFSGEAPPRSTGTLESAARSPYVAGVTTTDTIAAYFPWHFFEGLWGIRIYEREFLGFADALADRAACGVSDIAPFVLRQVLHHEWTHFAWEVAVTEMEDAAGKPLYSDYCRYRYNRPTTFCAGPVEESLATWAEVRYATFARIRGWQKPPGYLNAVRELSRSSGPGYREFAVMRTHSANVVADLAGNVLGHPVHTYRWGMIRQDECDQVPLFWVGNPKVAATVGLIPKTVAAPKAREFERWLREIGAVLDPTRGKGSHRSFVWAGRRGFYEISGDRLALKTAKSLAEFFGLAGPHELFQCVQRGIVPIPAGH